MMQDRLLNRQINQYVIQERAQSGGMAVVYKAFDQQRRETVAFKVLKDDCANQRQIVLHFRREAEITRRLNHPQIVPLYDFGESDGALYMVMRWMHGGSLRQALEGGPWDVEKTARMLDQITAALHAAHCAGIIHQDVKPDNILLDEDGNTYLADFLDDDVAYLADLGVGKSPDEQLKSADHAITGSIQYIAPEQFQAGPITPQTDLYSLGIVLYEMLTAQHPFAAATVSEFVSRLQAPLPDIRSVRGDLPASVNAVIQRATAQDPSGRYADALAMAAAFRAAS